MESYSWNGKINLFDDTKRCRLFIYNTSIDLIFAHSELIETQWVRLYAD